MDYVREAIEYLRSYNDLEKALKNLNEEILKLNTDLKCVKEIDYSGMPHGSGNETPDDMLVNKLYRKQKAIEEYGQTKKAIGRIDKVLEGLSEDESRVLKMWFIDNARRDDIAEALHCSEPNAYRIKNRAIRKLAIQLFGIKGLGG